MKMLLRLLTLILAALAPVAPLAADPADITAASRSVVRVVLAAKDGDRVVFVGHGSGFAVAPDKVLTNAHVVELARTEPSIIIGIVPSQGSASYGGQVIAFSPGNDLALLQVQDGGRLPPMGIFSGPVGDGGDVTAIGYPGSVDRAQGLNFDDMITPMTPVKTRGTISGGRSTKQFDTILHTAPIASGNSGGPLVDNCGRVLGANSFGSLSDGNDAEFGFAVSNRELLNFLRRAGVKPSVIASPCRTAAEISREEQARADAARAKVEAAQRAEAEKRTALEAQTRIQVEREIISERENYMALAALLLALSVMAAGAAALLFMRGQRNPAIAAVAGALILLIVAIFAFLSRPSFSEVEDRVADALRDKGGIQTGDSADEMAAVDDAASGKYSCTIIPERSRITVSQQDEVPFEWAEGGCVNGRTQYGRDGGNWSRIFVPNQEQTVTVNSFDPARAEYSVERYLLGLDAMTKAREIRRKYQNKSCTNNTDDLQDIADMISAIRVELPAQANERLVYRCQRG